MRWPYPTLPHRRLPQCLVRRCTTFHSRHRVLNFSRSVGLQAGVEPNMGTGLGSLAAGSRGRNARRGTSRGWSSKGLAAAEPGKAFVQAEVSGDRGLTTAIGKRISSRCGSHFGSCAGLHVTAVSAAGVPVNWLPWSPQSLEQLRPCTRRPRARETRTYHSSARTCKPLLFSDTTHPEIPNSCPSCSACAARGPPCHLWCVCYRRQKDALAGGPASLHI